VNDPFVGKLYHFAKNHASAGLDLNKNANYLANQFWKSCDILVLIYLVKMTNEKMQTNLQLVIFILIHFTFVIVLSTLQEN
jgi:hypothetical protein